VSVDLIGDPATGVLGKGLHYLSDVVALTGTYVGFRNTGLTLSLEETAQAALQSVKTIGRKTGDPVTVADLVFLEGSSELAGGSGGLRRGTPGSLPRIDRRAIDQNEIDDFTIQTCQDSCGAATGVEVLRDLGITKTVAEVAAEAGLNIGKKGIVTDFLVNALNRLAGREAFIGGRVALTDRTLKTILRNPRGIVLLDPGRSSHFVVVGGLDKNGLVNIQDPRGLGYKVTQKDFTELLQYEGFKGKRNGEAEIVLPLRRGR
jgi:predicted double-glycine peptidase